MAKGPWVNAKIGPKDRLIPEPAREGEGDPANGEPVARCTVCGHPSGRVMVGLWCGLYGSLRICEHCWFEANPPDPLSVVAA